MRIKATCLTIAASSLLAGCLHKGPNPDDPYESINRHIYHFNNVCDRFILRPPARLYQAGTADDHKEALFSSKSKIIWIWFGICGAAIVASDLVYYLWLRDPIYLEVSAVAKVYAVGLWANCLGILPYTALQAWGRSTTILKVHLLEMPFYLAALVVLTYYYGTLGAAVAYGLRSYVDYIILWKMCGYPVRRQGMFTALLLALVVLAFAMHRLF